MAASSVLPNFLNKDEKESCIHHFLWRIFPLKKVQSNDNLFRKKQSNGPEIGTSLLLGSSRTYSLKRSLVFQAAVTCCDSGGRVLFLTRRPITEMPLQVHCMPTPSTTNMINMDFLYIEQTSDLMKFLTSFHEELTHNIPTMIVVEEMDYYVEHIEERPNCEQYFSAFLAILQDVIHYSSIKRMTNCSLLVTCSKTEVCMKHFQILKLYFSNIWNVRSVDNDQSYALDKSADQFTLLDSVMFRQKNGQLYLDNVTTTNSINEANIR